MRFIFIINILKYKLLNLCPYKYITFRVKGKGMLILTHLLSTYDLFIKCLKTKNSSR